jgi:dihydrofolate reductase
MAKVILDMAMSLDGFIAGANDEDGGLHNYFFAPSADTAKVIEEGIATTGAIVMGKRTYNIGDQQDGFAETPYDVTHFVLTHQVPEKPTKGDTHFVFVTDGIKSAIAQAKAAAGDKDVAVGGGANIAQQCLKAGLVDEIQIHLIPVMLGKGIRLFEHLETEQLELESTRVIKASNVTHLQFRVVK